MATKGTSITKWCALGDPAPTGFTQVPVKGCNPVITSISEAPKPTQSPTGPRPQYETNCYSHEDPRISFTRDEAIDTFNRGCGTGLFDTKLIDPQHFAIFEGKKNITGIWGWSADQSRCEKRTDDMWSLSDCKTWFTAAMDNCDQGTTTEKWGSKMVYSSPKGCIDVDLYGLVRH
jgi:hypothetical protein